METYEYTCKYCKKKFVPTKRGIQKYCKDGHRATHHRILKREKKEEQRQLQLSSPELVQTENNSLEKPLDTKVEKKTKVEEMSLAGVGNVVAGNAITDLGKGILNLWTKEEDKPFTKGDMVKVLSHLERYQPINNLDVDAIGQNPYFDMETKTVVYSGFVNPFEKNKTLL